MSRTSTTICILLLLVGAVAMAALNLGTAPSASFHVPTYVVSLVGKYLCFAMLALAVDLVWGFAGILSLGHAAFFALGGYAMGMYLLREIGTRGVYGNALLPDFMVFLNYKELPWFLVRASATRCSPSSWRCWFPACSLWCSAGSPSAAG